MINVTKTFFPPLAEYNAHLRTVWEGGWLTNDGTLVPKLEKALRQYLGVKHLLFVSNGTLALQLAIKALDLRGEVITTPFSYVATTSSLVWEQCRPVFVDIDARSLCLNPDLLEAAITPATQAILATHVYGIPCAVERIEEIAQRHGLRVIYDAAHAFGVKYKEKSILQHGDISTLSFHATKLFHTGEGGGIVTNNDELARKLAYMRNFGHEGANNFVGLGINAKNSELHAAMGLCVLPYVPDLVRQRRQLVALYDQLLGQEVLQFPQAPATTAANYSYYPVLFRSEEQLLRVLDALQQEQIYPRRYFYPALTTLPYVTATDCPVATDAARRVLCLPLYYELTEADVVSIVNIVRRNL